MSFSKTRNHHRPMTIRRPRRSCNWLVFRRNNDTTKPSRGRQKGKAQKRCHGKNTKTREAISASIAAIIILSYLSSGQLPNTTLMRQKASTIAGCSNFRRINKNKYNSIYFRAVQGNCWIILFTQQTQVEQNAAKALKDRNQRYHNQIKLLPHFNDTVPATRKGHRWIHWMPHAGNCWPIVVSLVFLQGFVHLPIPKEDSSFPITTHQKSSVWAKAWLAGVACHLVTAEFLFL